MEMGQKTPQIVAKKLWNIMRIVLYMARKSKLILDLQIALQNRLKRGNKLARKAVSDLIILHHGGAHTSVAARLSCRSNDAAAVSFVGPHDYEFSCRNSPAAASCKRRKSNRHKNRRYDFPKALVTFKTLNSHNPRNLQSTQGYEGYKDYEGFEYFEDYEGFESYKGVSFQKVSETLNNEIVAVVESAASPLVAQPAVRQFPLKDSSEESSQIDKDAEEFIKKFYGDLKKQRRIAALEPPSPFHIWAH